MADFTRGDVQRLRPIVISSLTTVAGLFPTVYGIIARANLFLSSNKMAMVWGVVFRTFVLVSCLYAVEQDIKTWFFYRKRLLDNNG